MPEIGGIGVLTALLAGAASFFSPCVLPLVPGYLSAITGVSPHQLEHARWRTVLGPSLLFVASFSTIFILLGLTATGLSRSLNANIETLNKVAGVVVVVMGVVLASALFIDRLNAEWRVDGLLERAGNGGPLIAGAAFAIAWTPCLGPTLAAILGVASTSGSVLSGGVLLAVYSAGLAIPFLLSALTFRRMTTAFAIVKRNYRAIMTVAGVILIAMGMLMISGEFSRLNIETQTLLDSLGLNFFSDL